MAKLTKRQALTLCKEQWQWVADTGEDKEYYPFVGDIPFENCYAWIRPTEAALCHR